MLEQVCFQAFLRQEFAKAKSKNNSYSLRAFAKKLKIAPAALSEILSGKRSISEKMAQRLLLQLCAPPSTANDILKRFSEKKQTTLNSPKEIKGFSKIDADVYELISDWKSYAVLSLSETVGFKPNTKWIAKRLATNEREVRATIARLLRLGLLKTNKHKKWFTTDTHLSSSDDVKNLSVQKSHFENLELGKRVLEELPVEARDFTAITLAFDPAKLPQAKKLIREFLNQFASIMEATDKKEVYRFCLQLFPLSHEV